MLERGHVINAVLLGVGIGIMLEPSMTWATVAAVLAVGIPVLLGALLPDVDTSFGTHRVHGHNLVVLGAVVAFPVAFGNLAWVWLGVLTHYVLDLLGNVRGMALLYPVSTELYDAPVGVTVSSRWADFVTLWVTGLELAAAGAVLGVLQEGMVHVPPDVAVLASRLV